MIGLITQSFLNLRLGCWLEVIVVLFILRLVYRCVYNLYLSPLTKQRIPGPWIYSMTRMSFQWQIAWGQGWKLGQRLHKKYGPIVRSGPESIMVIDKYAIRDILQKSDLAKTPRYEGIRPHKDAPTLFTSCDKNFHHQRRRLLSPAFSIKYLYGLEGYFHNSIAQLMKNYERKILDGENVIVDNLYESFGKLAIDIIGQTAFGSSFYQLNDQDVPDVKWKQVPSMIAKALQRGVLRNIFPPIRYFLKVDHELNEIMKRVIHERRKVLNFHKDILQYLIDVGHNKNESKNINSKDQDTDIRPLTDRELIDQTGEVLISGSETTSNTMTYIVMGLLSSPNSMKKLYESIPPTPISVSIPKLNESRKEDTLYTYDEIKNNKQFEYLDAVIKEGMRMYPVAGHLPRYISKWEESFECLGYLIPPGTQVTASTRALHYDPLIWPEPERFWPERWLERNQRGNAPIADLDAYFPFSAGSRNCIGQNFAWMEIRLTLLALFQRYKIEEISNQNIQFRQYITFQIEGGKWYVKLIPRITPEKLKY